MPKRRSPRRHNVHTRDPKYEVKNYARGKVYPPGDPRFGLETRGHVTKTIHAWDVDDGLETQINFPFDEPDWRQFHNTTDSNGIDDPQSRQGKGADRKKDDKTKPEQIHEVLRAENPGFMTQYHIKEFKIEGDALKLPIRRGGKQVNVTIESKSGQYEVTAFDLKANAVIYQEAGIGRKNIFDAINLAMSKAKKHKPDADSKKKAKLEGGWSRVKAQEEGNVFRWLENKDGRIISVVPYGSKDPNDVSIRSSDPKLGRVEIMGSKSIVDKMTDSEIVSMVKRHLKLKESPKANKKKVAS